MTVISGAKLLSMVMRVQGWWGGVGAFWSISSKESGCCRLKYRSCSPVWLLNLLMFLLSAILSSILAVSIMRNMLGWCYFCCFLTAVIVPQCSWRKAMFSCGKERKGEKKLSNSKSRPEEGAVWFGRCRFFVQKLSLWMDVPMGCSAHTHRVPLEPVLAPSPQRTVRAAGWDAPAALQL